MSYILDALKKSENERQLGGVPNLQNAHLNGAAPARTSNKLLVGLVVLLIFNTSLMIAWGVKHLLEEKDEGGDAVNPAMVAQEAQTTVLPPVASVPVEAQAVTVNDRIDRPNERAEATMTEVTMAKPQPQPTEQERLLQEGYTLITPSQQEVKVDERVQRRQQDIDSYSDAYIEPGVGFDWDELPTVDSLDYSIVDQLPEQLAMSSHLYSSNPKYRSVVINGRYLKEGHLFAGGVKVVEIAEEGVILSADETLFKMYIE